jgi:hypothetical protein
MENEPNEQEFTIDRIDMGTGWVCFQGGDNPPPPTELALILNDACSVWLDRNPEFKVRAILPLVVEGNTVVINVWFD